MFLLVWRHIEKSSRVRKRNGTTLSHKSYGRAPFCLTMGRGRNGQLQERVNTANKNKLRSRAVLWNICHVGRAIRGHVNIGRLKVSENLSGAVLESSPELSVM